MNFLFFLNSFLFGVGLAMDAFSVSLANGLNEPAMARRKACGIAGVFALFQFLMPLIGWFCVHTAVRLFYSVQIFIPWIALALLVFLGVKMIWESVHAEPDAEKTSLKLGALLLQGVATSIDALSVGFTISEYGAAEAFCEAAIIAVTTFTICLAGVALGKKFGTKLAGKAEILGGVILIGIGIEILIGSFF